jgi:RimJ/RimL family protein N-acetyltransferase
VIETGRLALRRFRADDRSTVARWNADPDFTRNLAGVQTREQSDEAFDRWERHWQEHGFGLLAVEWRETGELIGRVGPQFHRYWPSDPEVGWALDPGWWGRGIATEAGAAAVAWAFGDLGCARLVSITTEANTASRNVMAKLGFQLHERIRASGASSGCTFSTRNNRSGCSVTGSLTGVLSPFCADSRFRRLC